MNYKIILPYTVSPLQVFYEDNRSVILLAGDSVEVSNNDGLHGYINYKKKDEPKTIFELNYDDVLVIEIEQAPEMEIKRTFFEKLWRRLHLA